MSYPWPYWSEDEWEKQIARVKAEDARSPADELDAIKKSLVAPRPILTEKKGPES